jgi:hypothetical protein
MDREENSATPKRPFSGPLNQALFGNFSTISQSTVLAATLRVSTGISSLQPPGCRKEDSSYKYSPFRGQQTCSLR